MTPTSFNEPISEALQAHGAVDEADHGLSPGIALCLSGGGYRAMLYHAGAILRLNELGILSRLSRVSSVSGGSIAAGVFALHWPKLQWDADKKRVETGSLMEQFVAPLRHVARQTIDLSSIGWGSVNPFRTISDEVVAAYDKHLFGGATLQNLADEDEKATPQVPRFVFTATNVKTGSLWRFAKPYMADYRVGIVDRPEVPLAVAVAASSAFPPFLSPMRLNLDRFQFRDGIPEENVARSLRAEAVLTDGGVYDNLGLEAVWKRYKTVLVSDGGRPTEDDLQPADDWARHSRRLIDLLQREVGALRVRQILSTFTDPAGSHKGSYWGIGTDTAKYLAKGLPCPFSATWPVAAIATRLAALSDTEQERIMNWGYASCDLSVRSYVDEFKVAAAPTHFPFTATGLGS